VKTHFNNLLLQDLPGSIDDKHSSNQPPIEDQDDHAQLKEGVAKDNLHQKTFSRRPGVGEEEEGKGKEEEGGEGGGSERTMTIAWRYQSKPKVQSLPFSNQFGHFYDLTVKMPRARVEAVQRVHFNALDSCFG